MCFVRVITIPVVELRSRIPAMDLLAQMSVGLKQHESGVSGEINGIGGESIRAAAIVDASGCVFIITAVW